ncbi:MAG: arylformamidase, partial [Candidatus Paceibacteria bacterium]
VVYPNNVPVSIETHAQMPEASTHLSKITLGSHSGTHVDAPMHAVEGAPTLDQIPLETFVGPCKVFDMSHLKGGEAVKIEDFEGKEVNEGDRVLIKTSNSERRFSEFYDDYVYLDGDCAEWLKEKKIRIFGIDYFSVKQRGSDDHRPHTSLLSANIPVIEGIDLKEVSGGEYELYCLPLKFTGIEGGPVRAILIE